MEKDRIGAGRYHHRHGAPLSRAAGTLLTSPAAIPDASHASLMLPRPCTAWLSAGGLIAPPIRPSTLRRFQRASLSGPSPSSQDPPASPQGEAGAEALISIDEVQRCLNRSRASVYRYTNTDPRNLNPPFNPRKLNPEYRSDQKEPLAFHPHEVARFARDVLRIKEVTVEVLNSPSTATQQLLASILEELRAIRVRLDGAGAASQRPGPAPAAALPVPPAA